MDLKVPKIKMPKIAQPAWNWLKSPIGPTKIVGKPLGKAQNYFGTAGLKEGHYSKTKALIGNKGLGAVNAIGKVPKGVPIVAAGLATLFEIPKLIHNLPIIGRDKDDGRFLDQTAESTCKVAGTAAGAWAGWAAGAAAAGVVIAKGAALGSLAGPVGLVAGAAVGLTVALIGAKVGDKIGTTLFGKKEEITIPQDNLFDPNSTMGGSSTMSFDPLMMDPFSSMDSYSMMYPEYANYA